MEYNLTSISIRDYRLSLLREAYGCLFDSNVQNLFDSCGNKDLITDNLQSHNVNLLDEKIKKFFGDRIVSTSAVKNDESEFGLLYVYTNDTTLKDDDNFLKLVNFFNYFITSSDETKIILESTYSDVMNDYINEKCNGIVYHICSPADTESILKNGLRAKRVLTGSYRYFPNRVYLFSVEPTKDFWEIVDKIASSLGYVNEPYNVIKVDLHRASRFFKVYSDVSYKTDSDGKLKFLFTYNTIPPSMLKKIR